MAPLPAAANVLRVAMEGAYGEDSNVVSRFFIAYSGTAPTAAQAATFAAAVATAWGTNLKTLAGGESELIRVVVEDLTSNTGAVGVGGSAVSGTRVGGPLPGSTCLVCSYQIARRYRGGHPRGYWPFGVVTDLNDAQTWTTAFQTACTTGLNAFFTAVLAAGWTGAGTLTHINVSYFNGFTVVTNPITHRARNVPTLRGTPLQDLVTAILVRQTPGTQRRRL